MDERTVSQIYQSTELSFLDIKTQNEEMQACLATAERAARSDVTILVLGEIGTGKNLIAQAVHNASPRRGKPFIAVNCSALTETLLESELFGHERGAFTGAERERRGRFELAHGGSLFLDEIGDMSVAAQAKILRAVEYHAFERVGGEQTHRSDARIIAATNRDVPALIAAGQFREDLYYRLNEVTLRVPALRERREDVPLLADHFVGECNRKFSKQVKGLSEATLRSLLRYEFPGNVRELRAMIKRGVAVAQRDVLSLDDLGVRVALINEEFRPDNEDLTLASAERRHIGLVLERTQGNKTQAARLLRIARSTLDRKLEAWQRGEGGLEGEPASDDAAAADAPGATPDAP